MKKIGILAIAASLVLASSCNESRRGNDSNVNEERNEAAAESNKDKFSAENQSDAEFVYSTVAHNYAEIRLADAAIDKSRTPVVKEAATKIKADHTFALNELKTLAQAKAISVPVQETDELQKKVENITETTNEEFDKKWCDQLLDMHEDSIDRFEKRLDDTEDPELKAFIEKTLPVLKNHYETLKACKEKLENKNS